MTAATYNNILLCDDDEDDIFLFRDAMSEIDDTAVIQSVNNGDELITALSTCGLPDIVFLDLNMPRKNGKECLLEIRRNSEFQDLPVVIYSTSANKRDIEDAYANGANLYIQKSNDFSKLKQTINKVLTSSRDNLLYVSKETFVLD